MIGRGVERVEAMPFVFDVGAFGERESHAAKNLDRAIEHLRERMKTAQLGWRARQSEMSMLASAADFARGAQFFRGFFDRRGDGGARFVQQFADDRTLFFRERLHLLAPGGNAAAASEITDARGLERLLVRRGGDFTPARRRAILRADETWRNL